MDSCLEVFSPVGDCAKSLHGPIGEWDVSHVTDMSDLFRDAALFNSDISKWDVSAVTTMQGMFKGASSFNGDISKWDVSRVTTMDSMLQGAKSFNRDISAWEVSKAITMDRMFQGATSFARILCGAFWLKSEATKDYMFTGSSGGFCFGCEMTATHTFYCTQSHHIDDR